MESRDWSRRKVVSGHFPEYGAIFMSNSSTLKECFEQRLFGLPNSLSSFVTRVKAGMILFLFEFEERKLYGVFEAISDGGMNIIPQAYVSSRGRFPAQVKFTTIWHCDPLLENEFRDAIRDNYFAPYKFNFGLSMDQIQSLLYLFSLKKLQIPNSLHHNKKKNRKQDSKYIKGEAKKGRFTKSDISGRKLNLDHSISVIAEPEVERHLSSDFCRKSESIHFDDVAYDPEHPGFHYSEGSEAHSASGHELHELLTLQQKKDNFHISAEDTEDYIPLFSPYHSDLEEGGFDFSECSGEEQIELGIFVCNKGSFIPVPQLPLGPMLSNEGYNQTKMEHPFATLHGSPCYRLDDSSSAALPLSDASEFQPKDGSNHLKSLLSKGLYSDNPKTRTSVFSRLNFYSKDSSSKNQNDATGKKLMNDISRLEQQSHDKCEKMEKVTPQKHENEVCNVDKRTSVFLRLTGASYPVAQQVHCMTGLKEGIDGCKKRKKKINFSEWKYYDKEDKSLILNQSPEMLASEYDMQADDIKEDMSVPEIL